MDHRTINIFDNIASSSLARSRAIAVLFPLPQNVPGSVSPRENVHVAILAADSKRSFWAAWTVMNNCRSQFGRQCAQLKESAILRVVRYNSWTTGSRRAGSAVVGSVVAGSTVVSSAVAGSTVVGSAAASFSSAGSAAASSSGAGTDGATSLHRVCYFLVCPRKFRLRPLW